MYCNVTANLYASFHLQCEFGILTKSVFVYFVLIGFCGPADEKRWRYAQLDDLGVCNSGQKNGGYRNLFSSIITLNGEISCYKPTAILCSVIATQLYSWRTDRWSFERIVYRVDVATLFASKCWYLIVSFKLIYRPHGRVDSTSFVWSSRTTIQPVHQNANSNRHFSIQMSIHREPYAYHF